VLIITDPARLGRREVRCGAVSDGSAKNIAAPRVSCKRSRTRSVYRARDYGNRSPPSDRSG